MNQQIYPCIWCNNNAKEMADFYCQTFKNTVIKKESPLVVEIEIGGSLIMLLNGGDMFKPNYSVSLMYSSVDKVEVEALYGKLSEGGQALMEFGPYDWSEGYAWVNDKYGVSWQLYTSKSEHMRQTVYTHIMYSGRYGKAREAAEFYVSAFPNSQLLGVMESPNGKMEHGECMLNGNLFAVLDQLEGHDIPFTEGMSLVVNCNNQQEIDFYWDKLLADGGSESHCGWLKDKYGLSWQIVPQHIDTLLAASPKAFEAMLKMNKLDIAVLEKAAKE